MSRSTEIIHCYFRRTDTGPFNPETFRTLKQTEMQPIKKQKHNHSWEKWIYFHAKNNAAKSNAEKSQNDK